MSNNIAEFDAGYDAFLDGEDFDPNQSQDWQDGYFEAQQVDCGGSC